MIRYGFHEHHFSILDSFIICLGEDHFGLNTWSDSLSSWNSMSKSLPSFGKFSAIVSFDKLFALLFLFWDSVMYKLVLSMASHNSCKFSSLSFIHFVLLTRWFQMTCLLVHRFFFFFHTVHPDFILVLLFIYFFVIIFFIVVDFVIHWNETAMGLHVFPIPFPPPTSLSTWSL